MTRRTARAAHLSMVPVTFRRVGGAVLFALLASMTVTTVGCGGPEPEELALEAAAKQLSVPTETLELDGPRPLEPSSCDIWSAWSPDQLDGATTPVVIDDDKVVTTGSGDEHLAQVAQHCYLDRGSVPSTDAGVDLVLSFATAISPGSWVYTSAEELAAEGSGAAWTPPTVQQTGGGFVVTFLANASETGESYRITAAITGAGADVARESI